MKKLKPLIVLLFIFTSCVSCREKPAEEKIPDKNYYLEFVNEGGPGMQEWTIKAVKRHLFGSRYIYTDALRDNKWAIGNDSTDVSRLDDHPAAVHHFHDISEYTESDKEAEKIVIIFRKRNKNKLYNFDFHSYRKNGGEEWQSVYNPGNFCFPYPNPEGMDKDLGVWMSDLIVKLSFK